MTHLETWLLAAAFVGVLGCGAENTRSLPPTNCLGVGKGERADVDVRLRAVPGALESVTASISQAGGRAEFRLSMDDSLLLSAIVDEVSAAILCEHGLVESVKLAPIFSPD